MKRKIYTWLTIIVAAGLIVLALVLNKKSTKSKTAQLQTNQTAVAVQTEVVTDTLYNLKFSSNGLLQGVHDLPFLSSIGGRVIKLLAREGDQVTRGQLLVQLDVETLKADEEASRVAYEATKRDYERFSNAHKDGGVTDQQLAAIHTQMIAAEGRYIASRRRLSDASIKAPISGKIYRSYIEEGSFVNPGSKLFDIVDDSQLKVTTYVTERQRLRIRKGQEVAVTSELYPNEIIQGKVSAISGKADPGLNFPIEVTISSKSVDLYPGMYVSISFGTEEQNRGILIPRRAIIGSIKDAHVYTVKQGIAHNTAIAAGRIVGNRIEVLSGLQKGDSIVIAGLINISHGVAVRNVNP